MRGRLLLLSGGAAADEVGLPLAGTAAEAFGPQDIDNGDRSFTLPLAGAAASTFGPLQVVAASDTSSSLPIVGAAAAAVAPTIAYDLSVSLPALGNVATPFAPRVVSYVSGSPTTPVNDPDEVVLTLHSNNGTLIRTLSKYRSFRFGDPLKVSSPGHGEIVLKRIIEAGAAKRE